MNNKLILGALGLVFIFLAAGIWLYNWVLGDTQAASSPISAPAIVVESSSSNDASIQTQPLQQSEPTKSDQTLIESKPLQNTTGNETSPSVFEIIQTDSQARFIIYEVLRGAPTDVIGISDQIAGQIVLDFSDLSKTQIGEILVNARTLATDDDRRNQAIRNRILFTDQYEYIRFQPTQITSLSGKGVPGQPFSFQIAGDLTIRDITQPVVFDVTMTGETLSRINGVAKTVINRSDFNLNVPDVPFVADVAEEVVIEIDLVLEAR